MRIEWAILLFVLQSFVLFGQGGFVGGARCAVCHAAQAETFAANRHHASTCEACHGPGLAHVEALDPEKLKVYAGSQADTVNRACLGCHAGDRRQAHRFESAHARNGVGCNGCHKVHGPDIRRQSSDALCSSCHAGVRASFERPFAHKLSQGAVHCADCHDPHGGQPASRVRTVGGHDAACMKCHVDKRGPFPFEHAPVRVQPCSTCHEPHGSANPRMLTRSNVSQLCLECHTATAGTAGGSPPAFHDLRTARYRNCTVCHSKTHGSFVNRDFLR
ncbi:MAG TPA: DmsE family decaheme c-type cytochrome [Bryobacteraceae bacterium]|nr:DmsE family decaheme c-type cytochrome [Bryobacteraceae bacterium]